MVQLIILIMICPTACLEIDIRMKTCSTSEDLLKPTKALEINNPFGLLIITSLATWLGRKLAFVV